MDQEKEERYAGAEQGRGAVYDNYGYQAELASRLHRDWPNGQKQVYVSQSTLYDSWSNMPGEEDSSSNINCKRCFLVLGIILLISGIIAGIVLAIYFSQRDTYVVPETTVAGTTMPPSTLPPATTTLPPTTTVPKPALKKFDVSLATKGNFEPALKDPTSKKYQEKAASIKSKMDDIYKNSSLADKYNGTDVLGFKKGSIIVNIRIYFIVIITPPAPTPAARNMTSPPGGDNTTAATSAPQLPDIVSKNVLEDIIRKSADVLELDDTNNNTIVVIEITTTAAPTTTPILTTAKPIVTTKRPVTAPAPTEMVTENPEPPITEPSKSTKNDGPTPTEHLTPTKQPSITKEPSPKSTEASKQDTTTLSITNAPATTTSAVITTPPQTNAPVPETRPPVTTRIAPTVKGTTPVLEVTTVLQTTPKLTTTEQQSVDEATVPPPPQQTESPSENATESFIFTTTAHKSLNTTTTIPPEQTALPKQNATGISISSTAAQEKPNPTAPTEFPSEEDTENPISITTAQQSSNETALDITTTISTESSINYTETTISPFMTTHAHENGSDHCNHGLASCRNNQCIRRDWFCDNHIDCFDASDEDDARCGRSTPKPGPKSTGEDLDCNFESLKKELCNYKKSSGGFIWSVISGSTTSDNTGPDFDHTFLNSNGRFLFTESSYGEYNDNATLTSVIVTTDSSSRSLIFYYHMYGAHMGSLKVYFDMITPNGVQRVLKWRESGNHGNRWLKACIAMPKDAKLSVEFIAFRGLNYTSDIAIDDIKYSTDECESISCTFEDSDCVYSLLNHENNTSSDSYSWRRVRGEEMMGKTLAPKTDFTLGKQYGAFLIADSAKGSPGDKATFRTPLIKVSKTVTLNFRLYISGTSIGNLRLNLLSQPDFGSNLTYQTSTDTNGWKRICVLVPSGFVGVAEFEAIRGNGFSGYIAVDDVALGPETTCKGFSMCRFENGLFCNFDVTGKNYRWRRYSALKGHYIIASGEGTEGTESKLVSPEFTPSPNSSVSFRYSIQGSSILSVWVKEITNGNQKMKKIWTTEGIMNGVQTTSNRAENLESSAVSMTQKNTNTNTNNYNHMDWLSGCIDLPMADRVSIKIVSRKVAREGGKVALDWAGIAETPCKIGLSYTACNFDEPNICGYKIDCPINTQYKWKRISGSTPTTSTGPLRDRTYNSTTGNYLYTEGSLGYPGDKAIVTFIDVQTAKNTSLRFYYYMSGRDIGALYIIVGKKSGEISWIQEGDKSPFWYSGCVDLPSNQKVNVSYYGIHGNGPLSDIAIDDVHLSNETCPEHQIACDFEDEMMCGYTGLSIRERRKDKSFNEQWVRTNMSSVILPQRDHTLNSPEGHFLSTTHPSKIISPRIAYGLTMCLQFYYYIQLGKGQNITVTADYEDNTKNKVKLFGTNGFSLPHWRHGQMTLVPGNVSVIFSVGPYNQEISSTFFAIDDVSIDYKKCPETVCEDKMFKCQKDDFCIPDYKRCDWVRDCSDGADELNCLANMTTIRLVDGVISGDQGRLEIYVNGSWGTAYGLRWFESNAKVACRQLGYTGYYKSVRFGKFYFGLGDVWQINCVGNETNLQDCDKVNVVNTIPHLYDIGLSCYNTDCEPDKKSCPKVANSSVNYCVYSNQFCDGDFDCPGGEDEMNCTDCQANEFSCKNHKCIPSSGRCDGKPDCMDASDEMNCIRRDVENNVEVYYNNTWSLLCDYGSNDAFYSSLCLIMGQGAGKRKTIRKSTAMGLVADPSTSKMTALGKYELSYSSKPCPKMKLECYGQECGSRSKKMFDPFVQFGSQAVPTEYPWQVMLLRNGNFHCGASIFNSRWLITAEHCVVERYVKYEVVAGLLRMQDLDKFPRLQVIQIIHSVFYGNYKGIPINDIALILLEKDLVFNDYIQPVCLPSKVYTSKDYCYLSGWGRDENLVGQSHLKETKVYAITSEECKKYYDNITDNSFICFRHDQPNMPSCYGDSGGPLVCRNDRGRFELVGVVSFGLPLCVAVNGTPAAFTNVLNFRGWIVDQTRCKMWCPNGKCLYEAETCDGINHCSDGSDELPPKCFPTVACNFGRAYKCGYRNDSVHPWYWSSPHWSTPYMKSKPITRGDAMTDEYMLASVNATKSSPARLVSPNATEIPCISFKYMANANESATTVLILKALGNDSSSYNVIWDNGKNNTQEQMFWKLATVSLPSMTTRLMFEAYYENPNEYSFIAIDSVKVMDKDCTVCSATEFQCNSGHCINASQVCDEIQQCSDASDELNCFKPTQPAGCDSDHFPCSNGQCILKGAECNGIKDCADGSDESNCTKPAGHCSWDQFHCNDGQCIEDYLKCDGVWHCKDGSDEIYCHKTTIGPPGICKWNQFRCNNGQCIDFHLKCDNIKQCRDGSDEQYCGDKSTVKPGGCTWDQFRCDNGQCIQTFLRCDRLWHCKDGSDEQNCLLSTQIPEHQCRKDQFRCSDGFCIQRNLSCDGIWHCIDGSDEEFCFSTTTATPAHCRWDQFRCNDGNCIESHRKCDGENHCKDGSDEQYCYRTSTEYPGPCLQSQFRCNNGQCIESFLKCDKVKHCKDGSDEQYCGTATIQPQGICRWDQFRCKDGQCIQYYHKCDQIWHCKDGSDEQNCPKALIKNQGCKYNEFGCLDGKCIEIILVCNQNKDCSLGEDEHNCTNTTYPIPTAATTAPMTKATDATVVANTTSKTTDSAAKIPLIKGTLPLVTKTIILPRRSTKVPFVTAAPIQRGTRINIPPVTAASIQNSTRINVPLVTSTPIRRGTRIHIPLDTAATIPRGTRFNVTLVTESHLQRSTRINVPLVTSTPIWHGTKIHIPLVTAATVPRGTRFNITLVTESPLQRSTRINVPLVTAAPVQRGTRIKISHVSTTSTSPHKTDSPHLTITPHHPRSDIIPNVTTTTSKHDTLISVSPKQNHHRTTKTNILLVTASHTPRHMRTFVHVPVTPIHHDRKEHSTVSGTTIHPKRLTAVTVSHHRTNLPHISTNNIPHDTEINVPYVTATPSPSHKTGHSDVTATSIPHHRKKSFPNVTAIPTDHGTSNIPPHVTSTSTPHHKTPLFYATTIVDHHKRTSIPHVRQTPRTPHRRVHPHLTTTEKLPMTRWISPFLTTQSSHHVTSVPTLFPTATQACAADEFRCDEKQCIPEEFICDVIPDCDNAKDELGCDESTTTVRTTQSNACLPNEFKCDQSQCIPNLFVCDDIPDCDNGRDELECEKTATTRLPKTCNVHEFRCSNGECILKSKRCDKMLDCSDKSDEQNCGHSIPSTIVNTTPTEPITMESTTMRPTTMRPTTMRPTTSACAQNQFHCPGSKCISLKKRCDGYPDCNDGADEKNCFATTTPKLAFTTLTTIQTTKACAQNQFRCPGSKCISLQKRCDGYPDCNDGADEKNCFTITSTKSPTTASTKSPTTTLPRVLTSTTQTPKSTSTMPTTQSIFTTRSTIPTTKACTADEFRCDEKQCIPKGFVCDVIPDCNNAKDELGCDESTTTVRTTESNACQVQEFRCSNGECILKSKRCDNTVDCSDKSDEQNCDHTIPSTTANISTIKPITTKPITMESTTLKSTTMRPTTNACAQNQFRCPGSKCISLKKRCDGYPDCNDGADEKNCFATTTPKLAFTTLTTIQTTKACEQNQFRCPGSKCISLKKRCDGYPDCNNGADEKNCFTITSTKSPTTASTKSPTTTLPRVLTSTTQTPKSTSTMPTTQSIFTTRSIIPTTKACAQNQFRCPGSKCISLKKRCDGYPDCNNGADEKNCFTITSTKSPTTASTKSPTTTLPRVLTSTTQTPKSTSTMPTTQSIFTTRSIIPTTKACAQNQFRCPGSKCISLQKRCDGYPDCNDGADEKNCFATTTPKLAFTTLTTIQTTKGCAADQFQCGDGNCISMSKYCDKFSDCGDGSDEKCSYSSTNKPKSTLKGCSYDDFRCDNGQCIPLSFHCDSLFDCNDRSDEKNCSRLTPTLPSIQGCEGDEFRCKNANCIKLAFVCDGLFDCPDLSDEQDCPVTTPTQVTTTTDFKICRQNEFECLSGKCINADYVCDGIPDCPSADDEDSCKVTTSSPKSSVTSSDKCFPLEVKECLQVGYSRILLPNVFGDKTYVQATERFYKDAMPIIKRQCSKKTLMLFCGTIFPLCKDGVSKYTCKSVCREIEQKCGKDSILMNTCDWLVDDSRWCFIGLTGNEELPVNHTKGKTVLHPKTQGCQKGFYQCKNSKLCLHPIHLCDGEPHCPQADDEHENCLCLPNQFKCASGQCVMKSRRCNGYQDCRDYSDERNCSVSECVGRLCKSGQCVSSNSFCNGIFDCDDLSDEKLCECKPPHRRCDNQVCVTADKWCNREDDCGDNSDEKNCDCSVGELMCSDGKCIPMEWWCDGNQDCSDGKDEAHCHQKTNSSSLQNLTTTTTTTPTTITTTVPTTTTMVFPFKDNCRPDEFICTRGYKCIKRTRVCDMNWDCVDGEDEATCVSLRKEASAKNSTAILTLTVQGQTSMVCSNKWSRDWAAFICKYLRHKGVKKVEFVDPPPGTTAFQQVPSHQLEYPEEDFIKTTETCETNKIVRMECNERICGTNRHYSIKYQDFIIGGDLARRYTWPWAVSLLYLGEPICGATLISERWLVTAAHCIVTGMWNRTKVPHYFSAILGEVDLFKGLMNGTRIPIDKIVLPGDMKLVVYNPDPDVALLRLKYPVQRDRQIEPICMAKLPKHDHGSTCYLAGWGGTHKPGGQFFLYGYYISYLKRAIKKNHLKCCDYIEDEKKRSNRLEKNEDRRRYSNFLHEVRMIIRNNSDCSSFRPQPNWEHNICAGYLESTITGCYGDNGGALMCWEPDNRWTLVGVLSKGRYNCAANSPNVFTKIGPMRGWMEESMGWTTEDEF